MERLKLFVTNFLVYGLGGIIGKIIPLIMLPIVTRLMPDTTYFGLNDISTVVVSFGTAIAIMGMYDAMFRMFFDKEDEGYKKNICSSALAFTLCTSLFVFLILVLFKSFWSNLLFGSREYSNLILLCAMSILIGGTNSIVSAPTRVTNQRKVYLITNLLSPIIAYGISVPLLLHGQYVIALPLASVISVFFMETIFFCLNRQWFSIKLLKWKYIKQMLTIALPLMPNFLVYWIFSSADRLMIAKILGNDFAGIYAIGGKVGQMSQLIYTAFAGGWQYFAFSTMKDEDQVELTSKIFEYLGVISFVAGIVMAVASQWIFNLLFVGEYRKGAVVAPYLFLAPLLLMLYQIGCNQFLVIKKPWPNLFILSGGALLNIILNVKWIPLMGIEGAALATLLGYIFSIVVCVLVLFKARLLMLSSKFLLIVLGTCAYFVVWRTVLWDDIILQIISGLILIIFFLLAYLRDIKILFVKKGEKYD